MEMKVMVKAYHVTLSLLAMLCLTSLKTYSYTYSSHGSYWG